MQEQRTEPRYGRNPKPHERRQMYDEVVIITFPSGQSTTMVKRPQVFGGDKLVPLLSLPSMRSPRGDSAPAVRVNCPSCGQFLAVQRGKVLDCFAFSIAAPVVLTCCRCRSEVCWSADSEPTKFGTEPCSPV